LLSGYLEPTNEGYALAKISGLKMCEYFSRQYGCNFISAMPCNLYGPNDNYDPENSHVLPALIRKCHLAKVRQEEEIVVWGSGTPLREFLHVDDLADACLYLLERVDYSDMLATGSPFLNVGSGREISIKDLLELTAEIVGYSGNIIYDKTKPDGTPRKLLDSSRLRRLGWSSKISMEDGIESSYEDFLKRFSEGTI
jgi:GDP-L-fucose synthase